MELGAVAIKGALERAKVSAELVDYVMMGQVIACGLGPLPARQASIKAGVPLHVPCITLNKVCISSISALVMADQAIRAGDVDIAVAGGMESMSQGCYYVPKGRFGYRMGNGKLIDGMINDALWLSLIHISEPTRLGMISYAVFCLKKKKKKTKNRLIFFFIFFFFFNDTATTEIYTE